MQESMYKSEGKCSLGASTPIPQPKAMSAGEELMQLVIAIQEEAAKVAQVSTQKLNCVMTPEIPTAVGHDKCIREYPPFQASLREQLFQISNYINIIYNNLERVDL